MRKFLLTYIISTCVLWIIYFILVHYRDLVQPCIGGECAQSGVGRLFVLILLSISQIPMSGFGVVLSKYCSVVVGIYLVFYVVILHQMDYFTMSYGLIPDLAPIGLIFLNVYIVRRILCPLVRK